MDTCIHHWLIGNPSGGIAPAHCLKCGAERTFKAVAGEDWSPRTPRWLTVDRNAVSVEQAKYSLAEER